MTTLTTYFITVHLFGFMSKDIRKTQYESFKQCLSTLDIRHAKTKGRNELEVVWVPERAYLSIVDHNKKTKEILICN